MVLQRANCRESRWARLWSDIANPAVAGSEMICGERGSQATMNLTPTSSQAAATLLAQYGPQLFQMATEDIQQYLRHLLAGDLDAVSELDAKLSNDAFLAKVKANTARWANVEAYNIARAQASRDFAIKVLPVMAAILAAVLGF
jgi:conjugal transfer/entry exclusion protein